MIIKSVDPGIFDPSTVPAESLITEVWDEGAWAFCSRYQRRENGKWVDLDSGIYRTNDWVKHHVTTAPHVFTLYVPGGPPDPAADVRAFLDAARVPGEALWPAEAVREALGYVKYSAGWRTAVATAERWSYRTEEHFKRWPRTPRSKRRDLYLSPDGMRLVARYSPRAPRRDAVLVYSKENRT